MNIKTIQDLENQFRNMDIDQELSLWIGSNYLTLNILVNDGFAYLHCFPAEKHPGFKSLNGMPHTRMVLVNTEDDIEVSDDSLVDLDSAFRAGKEFIQTKSIPKEIEWLEL